MCQAWCLHVLHLDQSHHLKSEEQLFTVQLEQHEITYKYEKTPSPTSIASNSSLRVIKKTSFYTCAFKDMSTKVAKTTSTINSQPLASKKGYHEFLPPSLIPVGTHISQIKLFSCALLVCMKPVLLLLFVLQTSVLPNALIRETSVIFLEE